VQPLRHHEWWLFQLRNRVQAGYVSGGSSGYGTVFKVDNTGNETVLYSFTGGTDGAFPYARLVRDSKGNLYGTTDFGGSHVNSGAVFAPIRN
jgi:uncharacterized repeat protein (TIGR03803 family)